VNQQIRLGSFEKLFGTLLNLYFLQRYEPGIRLIGTCTKRCPDWIEIKGGLSEQAGPD